MSKRKLLSGEIIERFVELVREKPFIYDPSDEAHKEAQKLNDVHDVWDSIAVKLHVDGLDGKGWRCKWKNMRDNYIKQKKRIIRRGGAAENMSKWKYYNLLQFLEPYITLAENDTETNVLQSDPDESNDDSDTIHDKIKSTLSSFNESGKASTSPMCSTPSQHKKRKNAKRSAECHEGPSLEVALSDFIIENKRSHRKAQVTEADPTELMFESYALRMKKLSKEMQSFVQLQMSQIFFNAENPNVLQIAITPLPKQEVT